MKENKFTKEMVNDYADKLLIGLTVEETNMVLEEFATIDEAINTINQIEGLDKVEPMTHCLDDFFHVFSHYPTTFGNFTSLSVCKSQLLKISLISKLSL